MLTKDREKLRNQAIDTLRRNSPTESFYNLTIVDDESMVSVTRDWRTAYENINVIRINGSKGITGQARNLGVYWAEKYWGRGDYLYLSDNDIYFQPGWLEKLISAFEYGEPHGLRLLGGWNHPYHHMNEMAHVDGLQIHTHYAVAGASQLMRWETWDKYGPLHAHAVGVCQGEDAQFCTDIIKDGGKVASIYPHVVFNCGLTNSHGNPAPGGDLVLKELQEAKNKYPDIVWE